MEGFCRASHIFSMAVMVEYDCGLYFLLYIGQYGVVEAALYRPSPGDVPIKVAIKKTKVCLCVDKCMHVCL